MSDEKKAMIKPFKSSIVCHACKQEALDAWIVNNAGQRVEVFITDRLDIMFGNGVIKVVHECPGHPG